MKNIALKILGENFLRSNFLRSKCNTAIVYVLKMDVAEKWSYTDHEYEGGILFCQTDLCVEKIDNKVLNQ